LTKTTIKVGQTYTLPEHMGGGVFIAVKPPLAYMYKLAMVDINSVVDTDKGGTAQAILFKDDKDSCHVTYSWEKGGRTPKRPVIHETNVGTVTIKDFSPCGVEVNITDLGAW